MRRYARCRQGSTVSWYATIRLGLQGGASHATRRRLMSDPARTELTDNAIQPTVIVEVDAALRSGLRRHGYVAVRAMENLLGLFDRLRASEDEQEGEGSAHELLLFVLGQLKTQSRLALETLTDLLRLLGPLEAASPPGAPAHAEEDAPARSRLAAVSLELRARGISSSQP
jgi:hypothetical protein